MLLRTGVVCASVQQVGAKRCDDNGAVVGSWLCWHSRRGQDCPKQPDFAEHLAAASLSKLGCW